MKGGWHPLAQCLERRPSRGSSGSFTRSGERRGRPWADRWGGRDEPRREQPAAGAGGRGPEDRARALAGRAEASEAGEGGDGAGQDPSERGRVNELALFAGAGGGVLGGLLCGFRTVCAVESNDYRRRVLMQRQDDGLLDPFPIWPDVPNLRRATLGSMRGCRHWRVPLPGHQRGRPRHRDRRRAKRPLGRDGARRSRGSTPLRPRGEQPNTHSSGPRASPR